MGRQALDRDGPVGLRVADLLFTLPNPPERVALVGELPGWRASLEQAGIEVVESVASASVVVATRRSKGTADIAHSQTLLVTDGRKHSLRRGCDEECLVVRAGRSGPRFVVPTRPRASLRYVLRCIQAPRTRFHAIRNEALVVMLPTRLGVWRWGATLETRGPATPFMVREALRLGVPDSVSWSLWLGDGDDMQRSVFHLYRAGDRVPSWVVKFSRIRGGDHSFDQDEVGLGYAAAVPPAAQRAPTLLGRATSGGYPMSVETAAVGVPMHAFLTSSRPFTERFAKVEAVAGWIREVAVSSARSSTPTSDSDGVDALGESVEPAMRLMASIPRSLQHNDLGTWNIVVDQYSFCVVDWEAAHPEGLPLWDLVYFLADALVMLDPTGSDAGDVERTLEIFRGDRPLSPFLFSQVRELRQALDIDVESIAPIVALCWEHHSRSHVGRGAPARLGQIASRWMADPRLGTSWDAWRR